MKIEEVIETEEVDIPEVKQNKDLMKNFTHGPIYQEAMNRLTRAWDGAEKRRKAGLKSVDSLTHLWHDDTHTTEMNSRMLEKMFDEMTYEKALNFLQSFNNMMTIDKNNTNGLNLLNSLGSAGGILIDLALLRLEVWNHDHRVLANKMALAITEDDDKKQKKVLTKAEEAEIARNKELIAQLPSPAGVCQLAMNQEPNLADDNPFHLTDFDLTQYKRLSYEDAVKRAEYIVRARKAHPHDNSWSSPSTTFDIVVLKLLEHELRLKAGLEQKPQQKKDEKKETKMAVTKAEGEKEEGLRAKLSEHQEKEVKQQEIKQHQQEKQTVQYAMTADGRIFPVLGKDR